MLKKIAIVAALAMPAFAFANPYIIAGGASADADLSDVEAFYGPGFESDNTFGRALIGFGADLSENLGFEAVYMTEGEVTVEEAGQKDILKNSGFQLALLGKVPLSEQFSLFGKMSANYLTVENEYTDYVIPTNSYSVEDSKFQLGYGIGGHFQLTDEAGLTLALERIQIRDAFTGVDSDSDLDQASLAFTFAF